MFWLFEIKLGTNCFVTFVFWIFLAIFALFRITFHTIHTNCTLSAVQKTQKVKQNMKFGWTKKMCKKKIETPAKLKNVSVVRILNWICYEIFCLFAKKKKKLRETESKIVSSMRITKNCFTCNSPIEFLACDNCLKLNNHLLLAANKIPFEGKMGNIIFLFVQFPVAGWPNRNIPEIDRCRISPQVHSTLRRWHFECCELNNFRFCTVYTTEWGTGRGKRKKKERK